MAERLPNIYVRGFPVGSPPGQDRRAQAEAGPDAGGRA